MARPGERAIIKGPCPVCRREDGLEFYITASRSPEYALDVHVTPGCVCRPRLTDNQLRRSVSDTMQIIVHGETEDG